MCGRLSMADRTRRRTARLVLFHKIHDGLVTVNMPLDMKYNSGPTRTENSLAYHIPASSVDYQKNSFFFRTVRDWNCLPDDTVYISHPEHLRDHILPWAVSEVLHYSGERESRPFHEEPETSVSILISGTTVLHLDIFVLRTQHWGTSTAIGQESSIWWSLTILRRRRIIIKNIKKY